MNPTRMSSEAQRVRYEEWREMAVLTVRMAKELWEGSVNLLLDRLAGK